MSHRRIYEAEQDVFGARLGDREHGMALSDARALCARYDPLLTVDRGKPRTYVSTYWDTDHRITLGGYAGLPVVLHELAHALTRSEPGHGVRFMREYLRLIEVEMSPWWARRLRAAIRRHKPRGWKAVCR